MKKETCENCKWYRGSTERERDAEIKEIIASRSGRGLFFFSGVCKRFPSEKEADYSDFCGEFKSRW